MWYTGTHTHGSVFVCVCVDCYSTNEVQVRVSIGF